MRQRSFLYMFGAAIAALATLLVAGIVFDGGIRKLDTFVRVARAGGHRLELGSSALDHPGVEPDVVLVSPIGDTETDQRAQDTSAASAALRPASVVVAPGADTTALSPSQRTAREKWLVFAAKGRAPPSL